MTPMIKTKICGLRDQASVQAAVDAGADFVGFVFAPTRRYVAPEIVARIVKGLPSFVASVGLFINEDAATIRAVARSCRLDYVQLCGDETPEFCRLVGVPVIKAVRVRGPRVLDDVALYARAVAWCVLDGFQPNAHGGTGTAFDWELARPVCATFRVMIAGGLTEANVGRAIRIARPWGVDVSSGVETNGEKDAAKIAAFVAAARQASLADEGEKSGGKVRNR